METKLVLTTNQDFEISSKSPPLADIFGHYVNIDNGDFENKGDYPSTYESFKKSLKLINKQPYKHILIYAHGGLNSQKDCAIRTKTMLKTFTDNGVYPIHIMYNTGFFKELKDEFSSRKVTWSDQSRLKVRRFFPSITDGFIETITKPIGRKLWKQMKSGAQDMFKNQKAGTKVVDEILKLAQEGNFKIHIVGHSTGAILLMHLLDYLSNGKKPIEITSCSLMAPAAKMDDFSKYYLPILNNKNSVKIKNMCIYCLNEKQEEDDKVTIFYRKSLLYLVSNSYETKNPEKLLGMQIYNKSIKTSDSKKFEIIYSGQKEYQNRCRSEKHGEFDEDPFTMNDILKRVLEVKVLPKSKFDENILKLVP